MKKSSIITLLVLLAIILLAALVLHTVQKRALEQKLEESEAGAAFRSGTSTANFTDLSGNVANLDQFLGQTLIVNSWASWSPASVDELRLLADVAKSYRDAGVVVIGINRAEPRTTAETFLKTVGLTDDVLLVVDEQDRYYKAIGGYAMPETVVYDTQGNVISHKRGPITAAELTEILDQTLKSGE